MENKFRIKKQLSFAELTVEIFPIGSDILISVYGGDKPHIGCTVLAIPRPSMSGKKISCTSSVINVTGHKDEIICRELAEKFCKKNNCVVVCTGGFHFDSITAEQISEVTNFIRENF